MFYLSDHPSWSMFACYRARRYQSNAAKYFIELAKRYFKKVNQKKLRAEL